MSAPDSFPLCARVAGLLYGSVDHPSGARRLRTDRDFPLAFLIGKSVADPQLHREYPGRGGSRRLLRRWQR